MNRSQRAGKENTYNKKNAVEPAITTKGADRMRKKGGLPKGNGQIAS